MYDATTGIALGNPIGGKWMILRTIDGGLSWSRIATEPNESNPAVGTRNGMATWGTSDIWFIAIIPSEMRWAIFRSTNGGTTWSGSFAGGADLPRLITFNDALNGFICWNVLSYRTTDGGNTWLSALISGGFSYSGLAGAGSSFFVSDLSTVWRSTNLGISWTSSFTANIGTLNHMDFVGVGTNARGWIVSQTGGIASAWFTVTDVNEADGKPSAFALFQNYPNPFNPSTRIEFQVPTFGFVNLKVFDILGREVATLVNENLQAGNYKMNFDASGLSSGVYLYRMQAGDFVQTRRMMVIK
jgi:hypothetical protein